MPGKIGSNNGPSRNLKVRRLHPCCKQSPLDSPLFQEWLQDFPMLGLHNRKHYLSDRTIPKVLHQALRGKVIRMIVGKQQRIHTVKRGLSGQHCGSRGWRGGAEGICGMVDGIHQKLHFPIFQQKTGIRDQCCPDHILHKHSPRPCSRGFRSSALNNGTTAGVISHVQSAVDIHII